MGRQFLGWENDPAYHAVAIKRLAEAANSAPLFDTAPTQGRLFGPP
jgi:DNA modification methylase